MRFPGFVYMLAFFCADFVGQCGNPLSPMLPRAPRIPAKLLQKLRQLLLAEAEVAQMKQAVHQCLSALPKGTFHQMEK